MAFKRSLTLFLRFTYHTLDTMGRTLVFLGILSFVIGLLSLFSPEKGSSKGASARTQEKTPPPQHGPVLREDELWEFTDAEEENKEVFLSDLLGRLFHNKSGKEAGTAELSMVSPDNLHYKNQSSYEIDPASAVEAFRGIEAADNGPLVLVIHSHTTEAYTPDEKDSYSPSDPYRTLDPEENMIRVGNVLCEVLESHGISTLHDETLYDYPNYNNAYSRSMAAIEAWLEEYPTISVVLDLHRDAIEYADGTAYRTQAAIEDEESAQVLILCGTDSSGLYHPHWQENLSFAFTLQSHMDAEYPGLSRPLKISQYRYNMQATTGSLLIEIGSHGNTMSEALKAAECFAEVLSDVLLYEPAKNANH